ncbi:MAG TPA: hypothetical protein VGH49_03730 [Xanthobacteraceae bacterium]|jgi:hypothetical protein
MTSFGRNVICAAALIIGVGMVLQVQAGRATPARPDLPVTAKVRSAHPAIRLAQAKLKPLHDQEVNLLGADQGGQAIIVPNEDWLKAINGNENDWLWVSVGQSAVFAFKDERPATFWKFSVLIKAEDVTNVKQIEILAGQDSPTGQFESVAKLDILNARMVKFPFQEVSFADTKAKYVKITILDGFGSRAFLGQIRLLGSPVP